MAPFELLARSRWLGILAWWHWSICLWWWGNKKLPGTERQVIWSCYTNTVIACFISHQHDIIFFWFFFFKDLLKSSRSEMRAGKLQYHWEREVRSCSRSKELGKCNWCGRANKVTGDKALLHLCRHALEQKHSSNVAFCHIIPFLLNFNSWLFACLWLGNKAPLCAATQRGYLV